jgi:hypothetical protein
MTRYLYMVDEVVVVREFALCSAPPIMLFCEVRRGCMQTIYPLVERARMLSEG